MMGLTPTPGPPPHIAHPVTPAPPPALPAEPTQPLPFMPGLRPEEFSTLIANTIADRLSAFFATNLPMPPRDRAPPVVEACLFCGQHNHYARNCNIAARYINDNRCKQDLQGRF